LACRFACFPRHESTSPRSPCFPVFRRRRLLEFVRSVQLTQSSQLPLQFLDDIGIRGIAVDALPLTGMFFQVEKRDAGPSRRPGVRDTVAVDQVPTDRFVRATCQSPEELRQVTGVAVVNNRSGVYAMSDLMPQRHRMCQPRLPRRRAVLQNEVQKHWTASRDSLSTPVAAHAAILSGNSSTSMPLFFSSSNPSER